MFLGNSPNRLQPGTLAIVLDRAAPKIPQVLPYVARVLARWMGS